MFLQVPAVQLWLGGSIFQKRKTEAHGIHEQNRQKNMIVCTVPVFHGHLFSVLGDLQVLSEVVRDSVMAVFAVYIYIYMYTCVAIIQSLYFYRTSFFLVGILLLSLHK